MCSFLKQSLPKSSARISTLKRLSWTQGLNAFVIVSRLTARHTVYGTAWLLTSYSGTKNSWLPFRISRWMSGGWFTILRGKAFSSASVSSCVVDTSHSSFFIKSCWAGKEKRKEVEIRLFAVSLCSFTVSLVSASMLNTDCLPSKDSNFSFTALPLVFVSRSQFNNRSPWAPLPNTLASERSTSSLCLSDLRKTHMPGSGSSCSFVHPFPKPGSSSPHASRQLSLFHANWAKFRAPCKESELTSGA
mmetsp:Transcript_63680/g.149563  ORF Transcript_63680/g.149563 Transcript_63680/m.149563 type:complete len:246 (-) Transcript_63680:12-749(-)